MELNHLADKQSNQLLRHLAAVNQCCFTCCTILDHQPPRTVPCFCSIAGCSAGGPSVVQADPLTQPLVLPMAVDACVTLTPSLCPFFIHQTIPLLDVVRLISVSCTASGIPQPLPDPAGIGQRCGSPVDADSSLVAASAASAASTCWPAASAEAAALIGTVSPPGRPRRPQQQKRQREGDGRTASHLRTCCIHDLSGISHLG